MMMRNMILDHVFTLKTNLSVVSAAAEGYNYATTVDTHPQQRGTRLG